MKFYMSFSCTHPLGDNWIEVEATDVMKAREAIFNYFGAKWAVIYTEEDFKSIYFPGGRVEKVLKGE